MQYNSPVILTFFLLSLGVLFLGQYTGGWTTTHLFSVYRSSLKDPLFYIRLFGHVLGHSGYSHYMNNMLLLLLVGPGLEEKYGSRIVEQQRKLGVSCDWSRSRFTMDEGCSRAVREAFCEMYDKGLIYRGNRMVNWCPHCNTSISDAEVEYEEKDGSFWHLLYPVKETGEMLELATTRPETMLGDTAVAINGEDPRYAHLHGCHVVLPLLNKEIPIVCDEHADMTKGTGVVKITPAHDPNDFEVGLRHNLDVIRVIADNGTINENGGNMPGAIGVPEEQLRQAAKLSVCKINIDSDLRLAMTGTIRKFMAEHPDKFDPREYLKPARANIKELVRHKLRDVLGCAGKA